MSLGDGRALKGLRVDKVGSFQSRSNDMTKSPIHRQPPSSQLQSPEENFSVPFQCRNGAIRCLSNFTDLFKSYPVWWGREQKTLLQCGTRFLKGKGVKEGWSFSREEILKAQEHAVLM